MGVLLILFETISSHHKALFSMLEQHTMLQLMHHKTVTQQATLALQHMHNRQHVQEHANLPNQAQTLLSSASKQAAIPHMAGIIHIMVHMVQIVKHDRWATAQPAYNLNMHTRTPSLEFFFFSSGVVTIPMKPGQHTTAARVCALNMRAFAQHALQLCACPAVQLASCRHQLLCSVAQQLFVKRVHVRRCIT